jgi:hypothetical protein
VIISSGKQAKANSRWCGIVVCGKMGLHKFVAFWLKCKTGQLPLTQQWKKRIFLPFFPVILQEISCGF